MNLLNSIGVQGNKGVEQVYKVPQTPVVKENKALDSFQKVANVTSPMTQNTNFSMNLYSPSQLLNAYANPIYANNLLNKSPEVKETLAQFGIEAKVYPENITKTIKNHVQTTGAIALQIANKMNLSQADKKTLEMACAFHDYGKILIPSEILNKPDSFTPAEKQVMDLHAKLGGDVLKASGMDSRVIDLIQNHHKPMSEVTDVLGQILSVADIYSALREERCYKAALSNEETLNILDQKAQNGEVSTEVVSALKNCVNESMMVA